MSLTAKFSLTQSSWHLGCSLRNDCVFEPRGSNPGMFGPGKLTPLSTVTRFEDRHEEERPSSPSGVKRNCFWARSCRDSFRHYSPRNCQPRRSESCNWETQDPPALGRLFISSPWRATGQIHSLDLREPKEGANCVGKKDIVTKWESEVRNNQSSEGAADSLYCSRHVSV